MANVLNLHARIYSANPCSFIQPEIDWHRSEVGFAVQARGTEVMGTSVSLQGTLEGSLGPGAVCQLLTKDSGKNLV